MNNRKEVVKDKVTLPMQTYELMDDTRSLDDRFRKVKIFIAHTGENLNNTSFSLESLVHLAKSLAHVPIVGCIKEGEESIYDFSGHEEKITITNDGIDFEYIGVPFGFIPEDHNAHIEIRDGKQWLVAEGFLWTKFNQSIDIFESNNGKKSQSMEIEDVLGYVDDEGVLHIEEAIFSALCILGNDVAPAMTGSTIEYFSTKHTFKDYVKEMALEFSKRGDDTVDEKEIKTNSEEELEKDELKKSPETEAEETQLDDNKQAAEDEKTPELDKTEDTGEKDDDETSDEEPVEAHKPDGSGDLGGEAGTVENVGPEGTGGRTTEGAPTPGGTPGPVGEPGPAAPTDFEVEVENYKKEIADLKSELSELKQFKLDIETQEKESILGSYAQDLSKDSLNKLKDEMSKYSVEEFEKEVAYTIFKNEKEADESSAKAFTYNFSDKGKDSGEFGTLSRLFK